MSDRPKATPYADIRNPFAVNENGAFAEYILRDPEAMPDLALGSRVLIHDRRGRESVWAGCTVVGLRAISPFQPDRENLLYVQDEGNDPGKVLADVKGPHTHQPMLIRVRLDQELVASPKGAAKRFQIQPVQRPPSGSSYLFFPELVPSDKAEEPTLEELLDLRTKGILLGYVGFGNTPYEYQGQLLEYRWDLSTLDNKHIFIVGESGSGKTVLLKNLALQIRLADKKMRVIMTDVQGDLAQMVVPEVADVPQKKGWQSKANTATLDESLRAMRPFQIVIPTIRNEKPSGNLAALMKLAKQNGTVVKEVGLRLQDLSAPSDVEFLFRVVSEQVAMLLDEEAEALQRQNQKVTIDRLRNAINTLMQTTQGQQIRSSGGTPYYASTAFASLRALKNLENYFDHHQPSMQNPGNPLDCLDFDGTTILYLEHLNHEERLMWEMQLVQWLYANKNAAWEAFVFVDEAHQIVPARAPETGSKGTFARLRANFERLAREGRKFGIHLVLSTQSPRDLHEIVPEQCQTRVVMKIDPKNAAAAFVESDLAMIASRFGHGQFWLRSPFNGSPDWVRVHSAAPQLPHMAMTPFGQKLKEKAKGG